MTFTSPPGSIRDLFGPAGPESTPILFWKHFFDDRPAHLARLTVDFYRTYDLSAAKIMPDVPILFDESALTSWSQLKHLRSFGDIDTVPRAADYIRTVKLTRDALEDDDLVWVTIFSPLCQIAIWLGGDEALREMVAAPREQAHEILWALAQVTSALSEECVKAGANVVYYGCRGQGVLSDQEYSEYGIPSDLAGLRGARSADFNVLHVHGPLNDRLDRYNGYPVEMVGWSEVESGVSLAEGVKVLPSKVVMGGIPEDRPGPTDEIVEDATRRIGDATSALGHRFLIAPGCSLPASIEDETLRQLRTLVSTQIPR
jgi:uroporphyrinogen decarboxylase